MVQPSGIGMPPLMMWSTWNEVEGSHVPGLVYVGEYQTSNFLSLYVSNTEQKATLFAIGLQWGMAFIFDLNNYHILELIEEQWEDKIKPRQYKAVDALAGTTVNLKTLDGRDLVIKLTDVVTPGYEVVIAKEGMPIVKENGRRGNLRIRFNVDFLIQKGVLICTFQILSTTVTSRRQY